MEILLFLTDTLALFILVYTSLRNDAKRPGEALIGPFRYDVNAEANAGANAGVDAGPAGAKPVTDRPDAPRGAPRPVPPRSGRF